MKITTQDRMPEKAATSDFSARVSQSEDWTIALVGPTIIESDGKIASFVLTRGTADSATTVFASTFDHTTSNSNDFIAFTNKKIKFSAGETSKTIAIILKGDAIFELPETFGLIIQPSRNTLPENHLAITTYRILDNDTVPTGVTPTIGDDKVRIDPQQREIAVDGLAGNDLLQLDFSSFTQDIFLFGDSSLSGANAHTVRTGSNSHIVHIENFETLVVRGGSGHDTLAFALDASGGHLAGEGGNDILTGGAGNDVIDGGSGNDIITDDGGRDVIRGGAGNDTITVGEGGADIVDGGAGKDTLILHRENATLAFNFTFDPSDRGVLALVDGTLISKFESLNFYSGSGDDRIVLKLAVNIAEFHRIFTGAGKDHVTLDFSTFSSDILYRSVEGQDIFTSDSKHGRHSVVVLDAESYTFLGGSGDDAIAATNNSGDDTLKGGAGNDSLNSGKGHDVVFGGGGNDLIAVDGTANDTIFGGSGRDTLIVTRGSGDTAFDFTFDGTSNQAVTLQDGTVFSNIELLRFDAGRGSDNITYKMAKHIEGNQYLDTRGGKDHVTIDFSSFNENVSLRFFLGRELIAQTEDKSHTLNINNAENFTFLGGSGDDDILTSTNAGKDTVFGGRGDDRIITNRGDDFLSGGAGNDYLLAGAGANTLKGGKGDDYMSAGNGAADIVSGGSGSDHLLLLRNKTTTAFDFTFDGARTKTLTLHDGTTIKGIETLSIYTGSGDDTLVFRNFNQTSDVQNIGGGKGNDHVTLDYSDFSTGIVLSDPGGHYIEGEVFDTGQTVKVYDTETLTFFGGSADDFTFLQFAKTKFVLYGYAGDDGLCSGRGDDVLFGGTGNDELSGGKGDDVLHGDEGNDLLFGETGDDVLNGGSGDDRIYGHDGADILIGGTGNDTMAGGTGRDIFRIASGDGRDTITDFNQVDDTIELEGFGLTRAAVLAGATEIGNDIVIDLGGGDVITLLGTNLAGLSVDDFAIV